MAIMWKKDEVNQNNPTTATNKLKQINSNRPKNEILDKMIRKIVQ